MSEDEARDDSTLRSGLAGAGVVALLVGCCAGLPLLAALAGSIAIGAALGIGAGIAVLVVLTGVPVVRARRRAACEAPEGRAEGQARRSLSPGPSR